MTKEPIDLAIELLKNDIQEYQKRWAKPRYDSRTEPKRISVDYWFGPWREFKAKLIASSEEWFELYKTIKPENVTFETIRPLLSNPSKQLLKDLEIYANQYPEAFAFEVYHCIGWVNAENPINPYARKPRGPLPYSWLTRRQRLFISRAAIKLYILLLDYKNAPEPVRKVLSKKYLLPPFFDYYGVPLEVLNHSRTLRETVHELIEKRLRCWGKFGDRFFTTFVYESEISLDHIRSLMPINPFRDPDLKVFFKPVLKNLKKS
jgi:hypothetical protein